MIRVVIQEPVAGLADARYGLEDYSFRPGEIVDLDDDLAAAWFASGIAKSKEEIEAELPPAPEPEPPDAPPPSGDPSETSVVQWPVAVTDTDIALTTPPTTVVLGSVFLIDQEYMTVNNVSNPDNVGVERGTHGSIAAAHEAGAPVSIWSSPAKQGRAKKARAGR